MCNDCNEYPSNCQDTNPLYQQDCGCPIEVNSFECVKYTGPNLVFIGTTGTTDGNALLTKIDTKIGELKTGQSKVAADSSDVCPAFLFEKIEAGLNISLSVVGSGCSRKLRIDSSTGGVAVDVKAKISATDTTNDYLTAKLVGGTFVQKTVLNPSGNEQIKFDVVPSTLLSADAGNQLTIGVDGKLKTSFTAPDGSETKVSAGAGVQVSGTGKTGDPYVIATNPSIVVARNCFDGVWRDVTITASGNASVTYVSGVPQYRIRFDGTIEMRGSATYTVAFGNSSGSRKFTIPLATLPTSCLTVPEHGATADIKGINYIDPSLLGDYGYIIRKSAQNLILEFQSSYTNATTKTIVVNFEGVASHPIL